MRNDARPAGERAQHELDPQRHESAGRQAERAHEPEAREREGRSDAEDAERRNPTLPADDATLRTEI